MRARVGAMPQPKSSQQEQPPRGGNRVRVESGMSLEALKRQTRTRLAAEGSDESSENAVGVGGADQQTTMHYHQHPPHHQYPRELAGPSHYVASPHMTPNALQYPQRSREYAPPSNGYNDALNNYGHESISRNYTDSQLGVQGGGTPGHGNMPPQFSSPPPPPNYRPSPQPLQQQYSTPRMPRHATVLKDRGSTENSEGSDPVSGGSDSMGYSYSGRGNSKPSPSPALKGNHQSGSYGKSLNKASATKSQPKEFRSPDGRHTPVRDRNMEGQILFATPNQRREVPTTPYSEPPRNRSHRPHQNMSPNYNRMRSPDHQGGNHSKGGGGGYYNKNQANKHHSKLPHGLTVQELKEMTRARLAAESDVGVPEGSSDQSVHSTGTGENSSKASDQYSLRGGSSVVQSNESMTRNLVQSNDSIRRDYSNQGLNAQAYQGQQPLQQMQPPNHQYNFPRHPSPVFGAGPGPNNFNGKQPPVPRQTSPAFGLSSSQTRSQGGSGEAWETASATSSTLASEYHHAAAEAFHSGNNSGSASMPFASPMSDPNAMTFNRARCFSAGAGGLPSSFEQHQAAYYDNIPLAGAANRQRCATVSPPGMSRLHEDRPFLFSTDDKERLAIPPLSEPRLRLHSTGGLNTHGTAMRAFSSSVPPQPNIGSGSAFVPIGKSNEQFMPQSPPPLNVDRAKFGPGDRTISTGSAVSAHGDLPSSMAEAVLESITSTSGAPIGGAVIGSSPFRSTKRDMVGESPFRASSTSDTNAPSAFRLDSLMPESSGSLFSSGESRNIFSPDRSGERMLLGTHSWGGADDETGHSNNGLSHDFSNLLNLSGNNLPALRGRAATEPSWFGGNDPLLVSRIDPEHNAEAKAPPRVSSLDDTMAQKFSGR